MSGIERQNDGWQSEPNRHPEISEVESMEHSYDDEESNRLQQQWESLSLVNLLLRDESTTAPQQHWKDELLPSQAGRNRTVASPGIQVAAAQV